MRLINTFLAFSFTICIATAQSELHWKFDTINAPSLEGNLLGDDPNRLIEVYLPPSYYNSDKKYPVVYYLEGYNSSNRRQNYKIKKHKQLIDEKIQNNLLNEIIFVYISGSNRLRGSFYVNSSVTGNWADFVTKDIINYVDASYRTLAQKESRSLIGISMGGYGALNLSMLYPEVFCAGYAISPGVYVDNGFANSQIIMKEGNIENTLKVIEMFSTLPKEKAHKKFINFLDTCTDRTLFFTMAYGAAHAPNTSKAPYFNFPFKAVGNDTVIDQNIWQQWQNGFGGLDWKVERYKNNLEQLKVYGIACGYNESYNWIYDGCFYLANKLAENRIKHVFYMHQGTHVSHTLDVLINNALPLVSNAMVY